MSEPPANVLVHFRLDQATPVRLRWLATDGTPLDGYKAQVTGIVLADGARLAMDATAILEQVVADPVGGLGDYLLTFTGMVGYAKDHVDRARVDRITEEQVGYVLAFVRDDGTTVEEGKAYTIADRPKAMARKLGS